MIVYADCSHNCTAIWKSCLWSITQLSNWKQKSIQTILYYALQNVLYPLQVSILDEFNFIKRYTTFAGETGRSRDTSGSGRWTTVAPSRGSSAPVIAVSSSSSNGDMFVAILLGSAGAFVVIVILVGVIVVLRCSSKQRHVERSPLKTSASLSNTRFSLNYLSPSADRSASCSVTAKVLAAATCLGFILYLFIYLL